MSLPRMSLHIGDYKKDTGHLRAAGHGAYLLLIMHYWATGGLPDDDKQLAAIACLSDRDWKQLRPVIRPLFGVAWRHKRIDAELAEAQAKYERRAAAGKRGGNAKAEGKQCSSIASPMLAQCSGIGLATDNPIKERKKDADPSGSAPQVPQAVSLEKELFDRGKDILGSSSGGLIRKLLSAKSNNVPLARAAIEMASTKQDPKEYIGAIIRGTGPPDDARARGDAW